MSIVYVHVGLPKTGTTHIQDRLWVNRDLALENAGLLYPGVHPEDHFHAAAHLQPERYLSWAAPEHAGAWPRMVAQMKAWPGTSIVSHELFANAGVEDLRRLVDDLAFAEEVHVILTVRDLARQLPSVYQENVKNQRPTDFATFLASVADHAPGGGGTGELHEEPFWEFQDYTAVVGKWSTLVPADRIHLVTVPAPGTAAQGDSLWDRFLSVLGVDPALLPKTGERHNMSLSAAQTEFLRRLNTRIPSGVIPWTRYENIVKRRFIGIALRNTSQGKPLGLSAQQREWAATESVRLIDAIAAAGCRITGTLDDLRVDLSVDVAETPEPTDEAVANAGLDALAYWIAAMPEPVDQRSAATRAKDVARRVKRRAVGLRDRLKG
ncbi:sulfotransferase family protein [Gordonia iterans]|uniref:Sulfotransferase family protein n=1 Tax=Gordonia iterans TaxID=1004901 RepID=A0A2S0KHL6_9ACTN|nr:sulfotransferase family protein [Gordonia iterans]AVM01188.1 sulfotransferase family protein [Gordonia iterans]